MERTKKKILIETSVVFVLAIGICKAAYILRFIPFVDTYMSTIVGITLLYVPIIYLIIRRRPIIFFDKNTAGITNSIKWFLIASVIIFPLFLFGNHFYQKIFFGFGLNRIKFDGIGPYFLFQLVVIALPEEFFYRGWFQGELNRICGHKFSFLGVKLGWGIIFAAILFAASHTIITFKWWHFSIFFPALLFGWLKEKTGSITTPILFHAASNCISKLITLNYL